jgi:hypothetical protein
VLASDPGGELGIHPRFEFCRLQVLGDLFGHVGAQSPGGRKMSRAAGNQSCQAK